MPAAVPSVGLEPVALAIWILPSQPPAAVGRGEHQIPVAAAVGVRQDRRRGDGEAVAAENRLVADQRAGGDVDLREGDVVDAAALVVVVVQDEQPGAAGVVENEEGDVAEPGAGAGEDVGVVVGPLSTLTPLSGPTGAPVSRLCRWTAPFWSRRRPAGSWGARW